MKFITLIISTIIYLVHPGINSFAGDKTLSLEEAVKAGVVKIKVKGLGGYQGKCLEATLTAGSKINLIVKPGTLFKPADPDMQDILVVKEEILALNKGVPKKIQLTGYCCKASNRCPQAGTGFTLSKNENKKLEEIAVYLNKNKFSDHIIQNAVWCVSDNKSVSYVYDSNREKVKGLREELCRLTGQENNWFQTEATHNMDENGYISMEPVHVTGDVTVKVDKTMILYQGVYKENGDIAWEPHKVAVVTSKGTMSYEFKMYVKGWAKGKYYVKVTNSGKELLKQEFMI
jgi:hypothetical protein